MARQECSPRGLFDPYYVPSRLLYRDEEIDILTRAYRDSYEDQYGMNCLVHGITGVGMTVFSRYFLTRVIPQSFDSHTVYVDAKNKDILEIVSELSDKTHSLLSSPITVAFDLDVLWMQFKRAAAATKRTVFVMDNIDETNEELYRKLAQLSKEIGASTIGVLNSHDYRMLTKTRSSGMLFDLEIALDTYSESQLYEIVRNRVEETFPHSLTEDVLRYITDLVCEFDAGRPRTTIEALKSLWPLAVRGCDIDSDAVRSATFRLTSSFLDQDYLELVDSLGMDDFMTLLVLETLSEHLMRCKTEVYIDRQTLNELVDIKCEELGVRRAAHDIDRGLQTLILQSIVFESRYSKQLLYVIVPPEILYDAAVSLRQELSKER
ncbi:MAG: hypothetical protein QXS20_02610 [Candidatus Thorarchaeota archaeon]